MGADRLLETLGRRVRERRAERGYTLNALAERSGLSCRFLIGVEGGQANISVRRLADLARALGSTPTALLAEPDGGTDRPPVIALLGLRGAGKTTIGRRLERETLERVLDEARAAGRPAVLAVGGGLVTSPETYSLLRRRALTVWLRADPEDHWNRVVQQGDRRPMADHPEAMAELRRLLAARQRLYAEADRTVDTSRLRIQGTVRAVERLLPP